MAMEDPPFIILNEGGMRPIPSPSPSTSPSPLSLSESSSPRYSSPASSVSIATHDTTRTKYHIRELGTFAARLEHAAESIFPNKGRSRYKNARVLLLRWEEDPMGVQYELDDLAEALENIYGFETETWLIPAVKSHFELMGKALQVVQDWGKADDLLIVYYAGHGLMNASRQAIWSCREDIAYASVQWYAIQTLFEQADSDVLILLDCCSAASGAPTDGTSASVTETIAACGFETWAPQPGRHSFTNTLIAVLKEWQHRGAFTAAMLHCEVLNRLRHEKPERYRNTERFEYRKSPIHIVSTSDPKARSVELCPRRSIMAAPPVPETSASVEPRGRGSVPSKFGRSFEEATECFESELPKPVPKADVYSSESISQVLDDASTAVPHVLISLALEEEQLLDFEQCRRWLQEFPALAKFAKVQGVYRSNSTLLLLSVPVAVWNWIPDDPACAFIGYAHSDNLLGNIPHAVDEGNDAVQQNATTAPAVSSLRSLPLSTKQQRQPKSQAWWNSVQHNRNGFIAVLCLAPLITTMIGLAANLGILKLPRYFGSEIRTEDRIKHLESRVTFRIGRSAGKNFYFTDILKDPETSASLSLGGADDAMVNLEHFWLTIPTLKLHAPPIITNCFSDRPGSIFGRFDGLEGTCPSSDIAHQTQQSWHYATEAWLSSVNDWTFHNSKLTEETQAWIDDRRRWEAPLTSPVDKASDETEPDPSDFGVVGSLVPIITIPVVRKLTSYIFTSFSGSVRPTRSSRGLLAAIYWLHQLLLLFYCRQSVPILILSLKERLGWSWIDSVDSPWKICWIGLVTIDLIYLITTYWYRKIPQRLSQNARPRPHRGGRRQSTQASRRGKEVVSLLEPIILPLLIVFLTHQMETLEYFAPPHPSRNPPHTELVLVFSGFLLAIESGWINIGFTSFSIWILAKAWDAMTRLVLHIWNFGKFLINRCHQWLSWGCSLAISVSRDILRMLWMLPSLLISLVSLCSMASVEVWRMLVDVFILALYCLRDLLYEAWALCKMNSIRVITFRPSMDHVRYTAEASLCTFSVLRSWLESHMRDVALVILIFEAIYLLMILISDTSWESLLYFFGSLLDTYLLREPASTILVLEFKAVHEWVISCFFSILMKGIALYLTVVAVVDMFKYILGTIDGRLGQSSKPLSDGPNVEDLLEVLSRSDIERLILLSPFPVHMEILLAIYKAVISAIIVFTIDYLSMTTSLPRPIDSPNLYSYIMIFGIWVVFYTARGAAKIWRPRPASGDSDRRLLEMLLKADRIDRAELTVVRILLNSYILRQVLHNSLILGIFIALYRFDDIGLRELVTRSVDYLSGFFVDSSLIGCFWICLYICVIIFVPENRALLLSIICWGISAAMIFITYPNFWSEEQDEGARFRFQIYTVGKSMLWFGFLVVFYFSSIGAVDYYRHGDYLNEWNELQYKSRSERLRSWGSTAHDDAWNSNARKRVTTDISKPKASYWKSTAKDDEEPPPYDPRLSY